MDDVLEEKKETGWFEIFRTGTWHNRQYTKADLDKIVGNFKKGDIEVPLFIGHTVEGDTSKPAEGWVADLKTVGNRLLAKAKDVSYYLIHSVNNGTYPSRSVELWPNINGRGLTLGGIAFLGAALPEVSGMPRVKFSKDDDGDYPIYAEEKGDTVCFSYTSTEKMVTDDGDQENMQHHNNGGGDSIMTKEEIEKMISDHVTQGVEQFRASAEFTGLVAENERLSSELAETRNHAATMAIQADLSECQAFAKELVTRKKITPAQFNAGLGAFLVSLDNSDKMEFSTGKPQTRREFAMEMLNSQAGSATLFNKVDNDVPRAGEDNTIPAEVEKFARENGLDPKIVAEQFNAQRRAYSAPTTDGDSGIMGVRVSIGAAKPAA